MKICIISKNNAPLIKTHYLFNPTDVLIFVEHSEAEQYKMLYPEYTIISVQKDNQPIAYFKNFILEYIADDYFVIATDNINGFYMRNDKYSYDKLYKTDNILKVMQQQLQSHSVYTIIPLELYTTVQTVNKQLQSKRGVLNVQEPAVFYGVNKKKLIDKKIVFDVTQSADDIDFAIQLISNNENICFDYKYACSVDIEKLKKDKQKQINYNHARQLRQKHGISFIKLNYDSNDKFISYKVMYSQIGTAQNKSKVLTQDYTNTEKIDDTELQKVLLAIWILDSTITKPTLDDILDYSKQSTFAEAKKYILQKIKENNLMFVLTKIEIPLLPILAKMKETGITLDIDYLSSLIDEYTQQLTIAANSIWTYAGERFNISSSQQLSHILFDVLKIPSVSCNKTELGTISTKESELRKLITLHPVIKDILVYRELKKLLSTYIEALPKLVDENNCIHSTLLQTGTTTGRMSSVKPNLQNIPVKTEHGKKIRQAFVARKGCVFIALDYSQIELRVAAILSNDTKMIDIFKHNKDIHTTVASEIFNVDATKVTSAMRRKAKIVNFGIIYGMSVKALHQNMVDASDDNEIITLSDAQHFHDEYFKNFKILAEYIENAKQNVARIGYTQTLFGRIRYFKTLKTASLQTKATLERMSVNMPIQGTSADIIKLAMIRVDNYITTHKLDNDLKMLLQIHDELIFEMKTTLDVTHIANIKKIMESVIPIDKTKGIVFEVNAKKGKNWSSLKDTKI